MDLTYIGYILFVIPGFILVWTYRHFTRATKIGEFEYAAWSFLWGVILFLAVYKILISQHASLSAAPLNDPFAVLGSAIGVAFVIILVASFFIGFLGVLLTPAFKWIDKLLFKIVEKISRDL